MSPSPPAPKPASAEVSNDGLRLEDMYRAHFAYVWRCLARYGVSDAQLDDAAQDVFLVVRRRMGDFRPDGSAKAWLHGICRRVAKDCRRSEARRQRRLALVPPPAPTQDPELAAATREAGQTVEAFLQTLDEASREAFVLHFVEGLGGREIATALGLNENTIYARIRRTRRRFERHCARARGDQLPDSDRGAS